MSEILTRASNEWWTRPADQRFLSLEELHTATLARAEEANVEIFFNKELNAWGNDPKEDDGNRVLLVDSPAGQLTPTHWSFGQLASRAKVPAKWAREDTHPQISALALNYGLLVTAPKDDSMLMTVQRPDGTTELRCMTGTGYGRIYDHTVVESVMNVNQSGRWKIPAASYASDNPRRASTLYASDRDVFIFLVDDETPIEVKRPGGEIETLFRGFFAWNSEVGSSSFGLTWFLYNFVCDNRIVWGAEEVHELRIRHTSGAPERFMREGQQILDKYATATLSGTAERIQKAMLQSAGNTEDDVTAFLRRNSFNLSEATRIVAKAKEEEGAASSIWDLVQGGTALARGIEHTDSRVAFERRASNLLKRVNV